MKFDSIDHIILLGGSRIVASLAEFLMKEPLFKFDIYTAPRQIDDVIYPDGSTLRSFLEARDIDYRVVDDINKDESFINSVGYNSLGLGLGEAWPFSKELIERFDGKLLDLMGIRLPQYRGGAHYTWQILRGNRIGACNIQVINEDMVQGVYDSGEIVYFKEYLFSEKARIPNDYFEEAVKQEVDFVFSFIKKVNQGHEFRPFHVQENFSILFPRLNTIKNAYLDWLWSSQEIDRFVCAFDDPYAGCSTFLNGEKVRLKKSSFESNDGPFHSFQCGLVYKVYNGAIYICTKDGTIIIRELFDEDGNDITNHVKPGQRFYTPQEELEKAHFSSVEL